MENNSISSISSAEEVKDYALMIESFLEDAKDYYAVSFKKNIEYDAENTTDDDLYDEICQYPGYLSDSKIEVVASTAGLHLLGKNKIPHIHYHAVVKASSIGKHNKNQTFLTNASKHRNDRGLMDKDLGVSVKPLDTKLPKFQFLSYPFKEGRPILCSVGKANMYNGKRMTKGMIQFLVEIGKSLYESSIAKNLIRDKHEERKKNSYLELLDLVKSSTIIFKSFRQLQEWAEEHYIEKKIEDDERVFIEVANYKKNLQSVAIVLKICKTYDF